jgi:hypothetical protein
VSNKVSAKIVENFTESKSSSYKQQNMLDVSIKSREYVHRASD